MPILFDGTGRPLCSSWDVAHFLPAVTVVGGQAVHECRTMKKRITALHSFIRFPIRGRSAPDGLESPSYERPCYRRPLCIR